MSSNRKRENDDASKSETVPNIVGFVAVKDEEEEEDLNSNQEESDGEGNEEVI